MRGNGHGIPGGVAGFLRSGADHVRSTPFVLVADVLEQIRVGNKQRLERDCSRSSVDGGVLERLFNLGLAEVPAGDPLRHTQTFTMRMSAEVEPRPILEPDTLDHERVSLPVSNRVPHETRGWIRRQWAS